ncbi:MAG: DUF1343 domain-containing protein [Pyrinomonadaceae bacterium MAG19_C2-C3]|nr:DUF1343 domain-containing protein [Pyrinomonadaceae bacterium MAG19_C2-C3]
MKHEVKLGIENLLSEKASLLKGARVGLVCNQASVNHAWRHVADEMHGDERINLTTLFGPQHGIRGDVQDNMIETAHTIDARTGLPVYSLYSETREPTEAMLKEVDIIVFDLQDVGCRIYTFIYTLANCMRAAAKFGKKVVVCDRPNPIGGVQVEGNVLEAGWESFVGQFPLPTRHGMTVCELAQLFKNEFGLECELETVCMTGWRREMYFDETGAPWVLPSPNMPTQETAEVFPGTVHLEGTQLSEGRGTTRPFELIGAPYVDANDFQAELAKYDLAGVVFRACNFMPTFQKHAGQVCGGVQLHVTDCRRFESVKCGVAIVKTAFDMYKDDFEWKSPPYEYVYDRNPFDVIAGTDKLRLMIESHAALDEIVTSWDAGLSEFAKVREKYLLY